MSPPLRSNRLVLLAGLLCLGIACRESASSPSPAPALAPHVSTAASGTPFDLGEVIRRVRFAYRPEGDGWTAGYRTWSAHVTSSGFTFTPRQALKPTSREEPGAAQVHSGTPASFGTPFFSRGGVPLELPAGPGTVSEEGSLVRMRGEVQEQMSNSAEGITQRWRFTGPPSGAGSLRIRVPVQGLRYVGETLHGVHFADATGLGVRYGQAVWTDALGKQTPLRAQFVEGTVELQVPEALLAQSDFPAMLGVSVSPEFGLDAPVTDPGAGQQTVPAVASNGMDFLVVWADTRAGNNDDLYGARVSPGGFLLDPLGIIISAEPNSQATPAVIWDGGRYFVVWSDGRRGGGSDIYGAHVESSGVVSEPGGIPIATSEDFTRFMKAPAVEYSGLKYLVVWEEVLGLNGTSDLLGLRLELDGSPSGPRFTLCDAPGNQLSPKLSFDGAHTLAVWQDDRAGNALIYASRISPEGAVLNPNGFALAEQSGVSQLEPAVAFNGVHHLVAWTHFPQGSFTADIHGTRLTPEGVVVDAGGRPWVSLSASQSRPVLTARGSEWLLVWEDTRFGNRDLGASLILPDGTLSHPSGQPALAGAGEQSAAAVAANSSGYLIAGQDSRGLDILGTWMHPDGTIRVPPGFRISRAPNSQMNPAVAFDGSNYLVVWQDNRSGSNFDIFGIRVSANGTVLEPTGFVIEGNTSNQIHPAVAFDGTNYLVVWEDYRVYGSDIYGTRVSKAGAVLDPGGRPIGARVDNQETPAVGFDGTNYLVVWYDNGNIAGTRVSRAGTVLNNPYIEISTANGSQTRPLLAFNGVNYLVAWTDFRAPIYSDVYGSRVSRAGTVLDPAGLPLATGSGGQFEPALAWDGVNFLLVWSDSKNLDTHLLARRLNPQGSPVDATPIPISTGPGSKREPSVVFDGEDYRIAWVDTRSGNWDLYGAHLSPQGVLRDASGFVISDTAAQESHITLKMGVAGTLAVYQSEDPSLGPGIERVKARLFVKNEPPVARAGTLTTEEDQPRALVLRGIDPEGARLTYAIVTPPVHGVLSGTRPNLTYTPAPNYHGPDSFTFTVSDGIDTSAPATVSITVPPVNDVPLVSEQALTTSEDTAVALTLTGSDVEGDTLSFIVESGPSHGTLSGTLPEIIYTPAPDYHGTDSFSFTASDGSAASAPATVSFTITPVMDAPVALGQSPTTNEDSTVAITLSGFDADGDSLSYSLSAFPAHGFLSGTPPHLLYTPAPDYHGTDSFSFTVFDGLTVSAPVDISLTVQSINDPPLASGRSSTLREDTALALLLSGSDGDGDPLTFTFDTLPAHGELSGTPPELTYTPAPDYQGPDSFTFTVSDAQSTSAPATVSLTITPGNDPPVAQALSASGEEDLPVALVLSGSDVDGDSVTFSLASPPSHGTLSGSPPHLTYTPEPDYHGTDSFSFTASDGQSSSAPATVSLTLAPVNDAPSATARTLTAREDSPLEVILTGADPDGDTLTFQLRSSPSHGTLTGSPPTLTYMPEPDYHGPDSFSFIASDGQTESEAVAISFTVSATNDAPIANAREFFVPAGSPRPIQLTGSDPEGEPLTFALVSLPGSGKLTGTPPELVYTPAPGFRGTTRFTFSVSDGSASSTANIQLIVEKRSLTVSAAVDSLHPAEGQQVRFYANAVDEAGAPISLQWDFGDGHTSQEALPVHAFSAPGTYEVRLQASTPAEVASTSRSLWVRASAHVTITPEDSSAAPVLVEEGTTLSFQIGEPQAGVAYTWDFGDDTPPVTETTAAHAWADDGTVPLTVTATDPGGTAWVATRAIQVQNTPPVPLPQEKLSVLVGEPISLQLSGSDAAGTNDPLQWELISPEGHLAPDGTFTWTASEEGLTTVIAKVIDGDGGEARLAFQIAATQAPPPPPPEEPSQGCGCGTGSGRASGAFSLGLLLMALAASTRRVRR